MNKIDQQLYEIFSDKTLSEGCKFTYKFGNFEMLDIGNSIRLLGIYHKLYQLFPCVIPDVNDSDYEILGHPPQLHDVFRLANEREWDVQVYNDRMNIFEVPPSPAMNPSQAHCIPYNPALPLLLQSDDTKSAIISLLK